MILHLVACVVIISSNQIKTKFIHAEEMVFLQKENNIEKDSILFTTSSPCELCAKKATHLGISKVYYITPYPGISIEHILSGNQNIELKIFSGAVGDYKKYLVYCNWLVGKPYFIDIVLRIMV